MKKLMKRTSAVLLALIMAAGMTACGSKKEEQPAAAEQTVESAEQAAQDQAAEEAAKAEAEKEAAAKAEAEKEAAEKAAAEKEAAAKAEAEKEAAAKPDEAAEPQQAEAIEKPDMTGEEPKEDKKKKKEKEPENDTTPGLELLDGRMTFDGMELEFPVDLDGMQLGNWKIEYENVEDPDNRVLAPQEVVTAVMTSDAFTEDDVKVIAEFGNYSNEKASLTDLPMTGIYITKGKGKDGKEPVLPEVTMPGGLTWGSTQEQIRELFGEASFNGSFVGMDFDFMYENGSYMAEFGGMNDTGLAYMVYCEE